MHTRMIVRKNYGHGSLEAGGTAHHIRKYQVGEVVKG